MDARLLLRATVFLLMLFGMLLYPGMLFDVTQHARSTCSTWEPQSP